MSRGGSRTAPARKRRYGLRLRLVLVSLAIVSLPLIAVWPIGYFEGLYREHLARDVRQVGEELLAELEGHDARIIEPAPSDGARGGPRLVAGGSGGEDLGPLVDAFAHDHHVMIRLLDGRGRVLRATSERHAEPWSDLRSLTRGASAFVFGQPGPPALLAHESGLPPEAERPEVRAALGGEPRDLWRDAEDSRMLVFYRAVPLGDGG